MKVKIHQWAREYNKCPQIIHSRLKNNWSIGSALGIRGGIQDVENYKK